MPVSSANIITTEILFIKIRISLMYRLFLKITDSIYVDLMIH